MSQGKTSPSPNPAKPVKSPTASPSRATNRGAPGSFTLGAWWRRGISVLLLVHLILIVAVPLAIMRPSSRLAGTITSWVRPYLDITQLSHGYGFFATEPGPSHLVEYQLEFSSKDGQEVAPVRGQFPNIKTQWPRLRYHRYFMLSEKLLIFLQPQPEPPPQLPEEALRTPWGVARSQLQQSEYQRDVERWQRNREMYDVIVKSYGQHLLAESGAALVRLRVARHLLPDPEAVRAGMSLNDPGSYVVLPGSEDQVAADAPPAGTAPSAEEIEPPRVRERSVAIPEERR